MTIALIAHDSKKELMVQFCTAYCRILSQHKLVATGTTGNLVQRATGLEVQAMLSGPMGGHQQVGALISEGKIDALIFFWDPLNAVPHDPDVKALLRIAQVYDIPIANNKASADFMITSSYMDQEYEHDIINFQQNIKDRADTL